MKVLTFQTDTGDAHERPLRTAVFRERSAFPASAACLVAGTMREVLSEQLRTSVSTRVTRPHIPDSQAWPLLCRDAVMYIVRGPAGEAAIVLREAQAAAFARALFGEASDEAAVLSAVERSVLCRALVQLSGTLTPVCGSPVSGAQPVTALNGYSTYFEVRTQPPWRLAIGVAVRDEPMTPPAPRFTLEQLAPVEFTAAVRYGRARVATADVMQLCAGTVIPFDRIGSGRAALMIGETKLARGAAGETGMQRAMLVESTQ